jgi:hypothetical protein
MPSTPAFEKAAQQAAQRAYKLILEMLQAQQTGEVAVIVDVQGLEPLKRVTVKSKRISLARGCMTDIETVG